MIQACKSEIHVLHILPTLGPGGMELALKRIVEGLASKGVRHSIVCLKGEPILHDHFDESVRIHSMYSGVNDCRLPLRLWRLIQQLRPTIIHARNWGAWPDVALARLLMFPRIPLIFSFHGFDTPPTQVPTKRRLAFKILIRMTTYFFTVTESTKLMLVNVIGLPAREIDVIPNGVDTERFIQHMQKHSEPECLKVGSVGSLTPVKNHALLIQACAELINSGINIELRIAGNGPLHEELLDLSKSLRIERHVRFLGHIAHVENFLRQLDIFVLPSKSEAHPNALLEAMACGLPCVATDVGGVKEVLDNGRVGCIIKPGDCSELVKLISQLAKNDSMRAKLGMLARNYVCEKYSLKNMVADYFYLYRTMSAKGSLSRPYLKKRLGRAC